MIQGEYGSAKAGEEKFGLQVIAMGNNNFDAYVLEGGLPGAGWTKGKGRFLVKGSINSDANTLNGKDGYSVKIKDMTATISKGDKELATLKRIERESPTLNAKAPEDADILFDGKNVDEWLNGKMENGLLIHGTTSKKKYHSYKLHLEFMTPYKPHARGQKRGNSGVYHQARYETQVLDSFALNGRWNETGGIYGIAPPIVNACLPPLRWQTYDVELTSAVYEDGKKVKNARITVKLNGILVQDNTDLKKATQASKLKEGPEPGPIYLQNHGNPVFYRNIWIVPVK